MTTTGSSDRAPGSRPAAGGPTAETADGERAYDLFQTGARFLAERHPGQAVMYLERAVLLAPDKTSVREALGRSYYALGRFDSAAETFAEIVRRAPAKDPCQPTASAARKPAPIRAALTATPTVSTRLTIVRKRSGFIAQTPGRGRWSRDPRR